MKSSIEKLIVHQVEPFEFNTAVITISILVVAIILKLLLGFFFKKNGKLINSTTLLATGTDSLNDCISTSAVLISMVICAIWPNGVADGIMGILVSLFIVYSGFKLIRETISPLIGEAPTKEFVNNVSEKLLSYDGVLGIHDMTIHTYGPEKVFMTVHAEVDSSVDINISHDIIDNIEQDFLKELNINLVIHLDPIDTKCEITMELKQKVKEGLEKIDSVLHFHDFRIVKGTTHTNLLFDIVVPAKFNLSNQEILDKLSEDFKNDEMIYNFVVNFDQDFTGGHYGK